MWGNEMQPEGKRRIRAVILDVDGTLTDGKIYGGDSGEVLKAFYVKDGQVLSYLTEMGVFPVIITGRKSRIVEMRAKELKIEYVFQGIRDKEACCREVLEILGCGWEEVLYIGDDLNDLTCLWKCGYTGCPSDAAEEVKEVCKYLSPFPGGHGAVRDCIKKAP